MDAIPELGIYGLDLIGRNLGLNALEKGFRVVAYDERASAREALAAAAAPGAGLSDAAFPAPGAEGGGCRLSLAADLPQLVASLARPRSLLVELPSEEALDRSLAALFPLLEPGDIIVDICDSHYKETERRSRLAAKHCLRYLGMGLAGGAEGARRGPSFMPGGESEAWSILRPRIELLAARSPSGEPCCAWMGSGGAGHFAKAAHNAIEYADMELIAEAYHLLKAALKASHEEIAGIFAEWGRTELSSYLMGITAEIFRTTEEDGEPLLDKVLDKAAQKGRGAKALELALELEAPAGILASAVFARSISSLKDERMAASTVLSGPKAHLSGLRSALIEGFRKALLAAKILSYAETFILLRRAAEEEGWELGLGRIAAIWREGSVIRSPFMDHLAEAFQRDPGLPSLLLDSHIKGLLDQTLPSLRRTLSLAIESGIPVPAFAASLAFYDEYRSTWLPAGLLQAIRDRFGAHGFERIDRPRGEIHHSAWS